MGRQVSQVLVVRRYHRSTQPSNQVLCFIGMMTHARYTVFIIIYSKLGRPALCPPLQKQQTAWSYHETAPIFRIDQRYRPPDLGWGRVRGHVRMGMRPNALTRRGYSFADVQEVANSSVELHSIASARRLSRRLHTQEGCGLTRAYIPKSPPCRQQRTNRSEMARQSYSSVIGYETTEAGVAHAETNTSLRCRAKERQSRCYSTWIGP
jgi:hypothetical protein